MSPSPPAILEPKFTTAASGSYIIKELCHHFEPNSSYTSLKLVRDNFGIKKIDK